MKDFEETPRPQDDKFDTKGVVACPWGRESLEKGEIYILKYDGSNAEELQATLDSERSKAKGFLIQFEPEFFQNLYALDDFDVARETFKQLWSELDLDTTDFSTIVQAPIYKGRIKSRQAVKYQIVMARKSLFDDIIPALYGESGASLEVVTEDQRNKVNKLLKHAPENAYRGNAPFMPTK